jgi:hypothetical protein
MLLGHSEYEKIKNLTDSYKLTPITEKRLGKYGLNSKELRHIWDSMEGSWARRDAVASKILQNAGFDALVETRKATNSLIAAPELFKFREPRYNFSYDRRGGKARGLEEVRSLLTETEIPPGALEQFAAGRSPALGRRGAKTMAAGASLSPSFSHVIPWGKAMTWDPVKQQWVPKIP